MFFVTGIVIALAVTLTTKPRVGYRRATLLGALSGVVTACLCAAVAFGTCVLIGCVG